MKKCIYCYKQKPKYLFYTLPDKSTCCHMCYASFIRHRTYNPITHLWVGERNITKIKIKKINVHNGLTKQAREKMRTKYNQWLILDYEYND